MKDVEINVDYRSKVVSKSACLEFDVAMVVISIPQLTVNLAKENWQVALTAEVDDSAIVLKPQLPDQVLNLSGTSAEEFELGRICDIVFLVILWNYQLGAHFLER